jgi:cell wall-associated NlpC family hydrolase
MRRILIAILSALAIGVSILIVAPAAQAAGGCTPGTTPSGASVYYCPIWVPTGGVPMFSSTSGSSSVVDHLYTGGTANWFYCKQNGSSYSTSGYTSSNWAKTIGDDSGATGWVSAVYFTGAEDYWAGLPDCSGSGSNPPPSTTCTQGTNPSGQTVYYCPIWVPSGGAPVYASTNTGSGVVDHLYTGGSVNWFYCKANGGTASAGGYTSSNWAKTIGDDSESTGWVPAVYFTGVQNYWAGLPDCAGTPPPPPPPPPTGTASGSACGHSYTNIPAAALAMITSACAQTGYIYAWNGGHTSTPGASRGSCSPANGAPNDCNVIGFDCSGLVRYAYYQATGVDGLNGYTWTQWSLAHSMGHRAEVNAGSNKHATAYAGQLQPGDIMWFGTSGSTSHHIAIYLGGSEVINAYQSGDHIERKPLSVFNDFLGAVRIW